MRPEASALSNDGAGVSRHRGQHRQDRTDEDAADGVLVVQVRRLRAISGDVSELEAPEALLNFMAERCATERSRLAG